MVAEEVEAAPQFQILLVGMAVVVEEAEQIMLELLLVEREVKDKTEAQQIIQAFFIQAAVEALLLPVLLLLEQVVMEPQIQLLEQALLILVVEVADLIQLA
jgi:hypothetical protein